MKLTQFLFVTSMLSCIYDVSWAADNGACSLSYRPKANETAFAAVGSTLKISDKTCFNSYLIIPFDTKSGAVDIPQGEYEAVKVSKQSYLFAPTSLSGDKVSSCVVCDPIKYLKINTNTPKTLCVQTLLNVDSCAIDNSISYTVTKKSNTTLGICTPSLVYFGRDGETLKFAINDCSTISKPTLSYDLSLGNTIRFLDEEIRIIKADNQGIYYSRLDAPQIQDHKLFTEDELNEVLASTRSALSPVANQKATEEKITDVDTTANTDESKEKTSDTPKQTDVSSDETTLKPQNVQSKI